MASLSMASFMSRVCMVGVLPLGLLGVMSLADALLGSLVGSLTGSLMGSLPDGMVMGQTAAVQGTLGQVLPGQAVLAANPGPVSNPVLKVGIVQRFGSKLSDKLELRANPGEVLTLRFPSPEGPKTLTVPTVLIEINSQPLSKAEWRERLVLSTHRSFESAEDSANQWRSRGIPVEIGQPEGWQVWASRGVYDTPLVRRMLLQDLRLKNHALPFLDGQEVTQVPRASFVVGGFRYNRDELEISSNGRTVLVNKTPFPGSFRLQPNTYGTYTLVNRVAMEDYLRGVVPHEIGPKAPKAAIEAQAILARTYALRNLRRFAIDNYELCADTQCQVYFGWKETLPKVNEAIANTSGQVLTYNNELVDAVYSSTSGGISAAFNDVWNGTARPYLRPVVDTVSNSWDLSRRPLSEENNFRQFIGLSQGFNEVGWRYFRWRNEALLPTLTKEIKTYLAGKQHPLRDLTQVQRLEVVARATGGRVQRLRITTDKGPVVLEKDEIIRAVEAPNSLLFYLEPLYQGDKKTLKGYAFVGGGLGHGVGLSQTGSYKLAELGWSSSRILGFYYPGTKLQPLSPTITYWREP